MENSLRAALRPFQATAPLHDGKHAAVAIILWGPHFELLLIRRAQDPNDPWSGHMALPGGRHEMTDVSLEATAQRETLEEVGVRLQRAALLGNLQSRAVSGRSGAGGLWVTPFVYRMNGPRPVTQPDQREVAEIVWVPLSHLCAPESQTKHPHKTETGTTYFPAWKIGAHRVWGLTYGMLRELLKHTKLQHL